MPWVPKMGDRRLANCWNASKLPKGWPVAALPPAPAPAPAPAAAACAAEDVVDAILVVVAVKTRAPCRILWEACRDGVHCGALGLGVTASEARIKHIRGGVDKPPSRADFCPSPTAFASGLCRGGEMRRVSNGANRVRGRRVPVRVPAPTDEASSGDIWGSSGGYLDPGVCWPPGGCSPATAACCVHPPQANQVAAETRQAEPA